MKKLSVNAKYKFHKTEICLHFCLNLLLCIQCVEKKNNCHIYCAQEKTMAPHSNTLAWKISWTEEPGRLQSMGSLSRRLSDFTLTFHFHTLEKEMATHSSVLVWRIPGTGKPGGLPSMGSQRLGQTEAT